MVLIGLLRKLKVIPVFWKGVWGNWIFYGWFIPACLAVKLFLAVKIIYFG